MALKVVFLDWYGTLSVSRFFEHWTSPDHRYYQHFLDIQRWWDSSADLEFQRDWLVGKRSTDDWLEIASGLSGLEISVLRSELIEGMRGWRLIEPATLELVCALQARGVRVVIASDNVDVFDKFALPAMGLSETFDGVLNSAVLGYQKGDPDEFGRSRFFVPYLESNGIGSGESVLIDDSEGVRQVIERTGIRFLHAPKGTGPGRNLRELLVSG